MAATFLALGLSNIWTLVRGYGQGDASRHDTPAPGDVDVLAFGVLVGA